MELIASVVQQAVTLVSYVIKIKIKKMKTKTQIIYLNCHYLLMDHRFQMEKKSLLMRTKCNMGCQARARARCEVLLEHHQSCKELEKQKNSRCVRLVLVCAAEK